MSLLAKNVLGQNSILVIWLFPIDLKITLYTCRRTQRQRGDRQPLLSELGTYKTVKARFGPWLSDKSSLKLSRCCLFSAAAGEVDDAHHSGVFKAHSLVYHSTLGLTVIKGEVIQSCFAMNVPPAHL